MRRPLGEVPLTAPRIRTARLVLRPFVADDADELLEMFREPCVRQYLLDDAIVPAEWVEAEVAASDARFEESGCGPWSIGTEPDGPIVGFAG